MEWMGFRKMARPVEEKSDGADIYIGGKIEDKP